MSDDPGPLRRRRDPQWLQAARGLALVVVLGVTVGIVGLVLAWLATWLG